MHTAPVFGVYRQRFRDSVIHKNVLGYGLLHSGKRRWGLEDSSRGMPVTQPSDTTQVHHPSTQASLCKDILLPILETFGKAQERVCQVPGSHFDQNSKCRQYFFFSARQVAVLGSHWGLRGISMEEGNLYVFPKKMARGVVPHREELVWLVCLLSQGEGWR